MKIPHGAHSGAGSCKERLIAAFVDRGTAQGLDTSCIQAAPLVPFATKAAKP